jgi:hypothetical protein
MPESGGSSASGSSDVTGKIALFPTGAQKHRDADSRRT